MDSLKLDSKGLGHDDKHMLFTLCIHKVCNPFMVIMS
jgi:hypothetical protein